MKKHTYPQTEMLCPHCEEYFDVFYTPEDPGQTYGPPEKCWEGHATEFETPDECPECGETFSKDEIARMEERAEEEMKERSDDDRY